jgi:hypothetical protein
VELREMQGSSFPAVSAMRVVLKDATVSGREKVSNLAVDLAAVAVFDRQTFFKAIRTYDRDSFGEQLMELTGHPLFVAASRNSEIFIAPSGAGDGTYAVYALTEGERPIGLEVSFIDRATREAE